jgi:Tfp pilus assembly major pilin PilA
MKREKGNTLVIVMIVAILVSSSVAIGFNYVISKDKTVRAFQQLVQLKYSAEAALEEVKANIRYSSYVNGRNQYLMNNSSYGGTTVFTKTLGNTMITAKLFSLGGYWHRIEAFATGTDNIRYGLAVQVRERDDFSKYLFFVDLDDINIGTTTIRGQVHGNKRIKNYFGGAKYYENVEAANQGTGSCPSGCSCNYGFAYCSGATASNTYYYKNTDPQAQYIPLPTTNDIATLHNYAVDCYDVSNSSTCWSSYGNFNTEIEFIFDAFSQTTKVKITAKHITTGATLKSVTLPLPPNNLIFVQNKITSLKGDLYGRVTIAVQDSSRCGVGDADTCNAAVNLTGPINYLDQDGDKAYLLYDQYNNVVNDTPAGVKWVEPQYRYKANPNYNPVTPSNLAIMAVGDIKQKCSTSPYNLTVNGVFLSSQGNWHLGLSCSTNSKGNYRFVGAMISKYSGWRYSCLNPPSCTSYEGWGLSGEYIYDTNLLNNPPEWMLQINKPLFVSYRRIY